MSVPAYLTSNPSDTSTSTHSSDELLLFNLSECTVTLISSLPEELQDLWVLQVALTSIPYEAKISGD